MSRELRDAILLSFDNLGEAADLERGTAQGPIGDDPSVAVGLPRALEALAALDLRATFFVEGLNAELYPQALRDIAAAGHEVGLHGWRHEVWDALTPDEEDELLGRGVAAFDGLGLEVEGFRPPGGGLGPRTFEALAAPWPALVLAGGRAPRAHGGHRVPALPLAGGRRLPPTRVLHRPAHVLGRPGGRRLAARGRRCSHRRPRRAG